MLDLLIIFILVVSMTVGFRRGLVSQSFRIGSNALAFGVAYFLYEKLASVFVFWVPYPNVHAHDILQWMPDTVVADLTFYNAFAFIVIFFLVKLTSDALIASLDHWRYVPVFPFWTRFIAGLLGFVEWFLILFFFSAIFALLPIETVHGWYEQSMLAEMMFEHTPIVSNMMDRIWFVYR